METIPIIYQDQHLIIIDKPIGVLSIPDGYDPGLPHLKSLLEPEIGLLWMVHRLDKETSGVMVLARDASSHKALNQQFMERQVYKEYQCLVSPCPAWQTTYVRQPLRVNTGRSHLTRVDSRRGKPAQSEFSVAGRYGDIALLNCVIQTGYRHQIRAHLYDLGLGILGDLLYRPAQQPYSAHLFPRLMLHARKIAFLHPFTNQKVSFTAETPASFYELLETIIPTNADTDASST